MRTVLSVCLLAIATLIGCSDDPAGSSSAEATEALDLQAEIEPLGDFSKDTGLLPAGSPAQVSLKLSAGGKLKVTAAVAREGDALAGKRGGGKLSLDVHAKLDGRLKIASALKPIDTDLPGLKDVDVPIRAEVLFDPFLLGEGEQAKVEAQVPETKLPPIPLGSVPGTLQLTIAKGSTLDTTFRGTCLAVRGGRASYAGEATTGGTLVLKGTIALELPGLSKAVELGEIRVPIPASRRALVFGEAAVEGVADTREGSACDGAGAEGASSEKAQEKEKATTTPADPAPAADAGPATPAAQPLTGTFAGKLATTTPRPFGGSGHCDYTIAMKDVALSLTIADRSVIALRVDSTMVEQVVGKCPVPSIAPNRHEHMLVFAADASPLFEDGEVEVHLASDEAAAPRTTASVKLRRVAGFLDATITWRRDDDQAAPLMWTAYGFVRTTAAGK